MTALVSKFRDLIASNVLEHDPAQLLLVEKFELLSNRISKYSPPERTDIFSYFTRNRGEIPKGLYVYGGVGRGKTFAMDMFYDMVPLTSKRRAHFHEFMLEVHRKIGDARKDGREDPIKYAAKSITRTTTLLCFDEFHVTDITDAMVLGRLFEQLLKRGTIIVATSNSHPRDLYKDGLNRGLFIPFIDLIENHLEVFELDYQKDYRLSKLANQELYFILDTPTAQSSMDTIWGNMTMGNSVSTVEHELNGRTLIVPRASMGVARFTFDELCGQPLGTEDYLALARAYHTLFIDHIPRLTPEHRNEARRFINLIDTLYDNRVKLVASAEAEPDALYVAGNASGMFERTASRLIDMRSVEYLAAAHGPNLA